MQKIILKVAAVILLLFTLPPVFSQYYDWPMWRYNHERSASTPEQLADKLYLQWEVQYAPRIPVWDDPLNQNLMQFDRIFEPIVAGNKMFLGFNDQDKVVALDLNTGKELWHYYADGPVRLPLAEANGKLYFTSDDGILYCLNNNNGSLVWKVALAPASNKLLGNKRLISMWPARGGIVIKDNVIYTAASIFPLMGTFIYAIDTKDGSIIWKNDGTGSNYILQPHKSPAFADVAPQGSFTLSGNKLLVAGGRTVPAGFDTRTGEELFYHLAASGKTGGSFTCGNDRVYFNHHRGRMTYMYDSNTGTVIKKDVGEYPVVDGNSIFFSGKNIIRTALNSKNQLDTIWTMDVPATNDLIKAGNYLYSADSTGINALKLNGNNIPELAWSLASDKIIDRLVASNGKLIAVSNDGTIRVFGDKPAAKIARFTGPEISVGGSTKANKIISSTGITDGYALVLGTNDVKLLKGLVSKTSLSVIAYGKDPARIAYLREYFDQLGVTANRMSFLQYDKTQPLLPKYFASLTVVSDNDFLNGYDKDVLNLIFESTRPYGGKIFISAKGKEQDHLSGSFREMDLYGAELALDKGFTIISRNGPLEGTDSWTGNYGDVANTMKSDDNLVKAPLGILWFGGNSNLDVLPRHGHGPCEQVIDGKLIIEGVSCISARDVYTGRVLWKRDFPKLMDDSWMVYFDESYDGESPLDTKYNQEHLAGSNARGTNFIATKEYVYLIEGNKCSVIDINTGELARTFTTGDERTEELGYIGVYEDLLILGNNFSEFKHMLENDSIAIEDPGFTKFDVSASQELVVLDRFSGKRLWNIKANTGFIHNSVIAGDGVLFCLDKLPQYLETKLKRRGETLPGESRLLYLDIRTGKKLYEETGDIFGTWLGYSSQHKLLLQANRPSGDMLHGEEGRRMIAYNTATKEKIWDKAMTYGNPPIIHNDKIYANGIAWHLLTGEPFIEKDPITGEDLKWTFKREYGCGSIVASEHLLTFRSASAGFVNLDVFEGTGSLGGWKASCSTNLIVADGVLNSPDYTRTCQCPYQNQTSLALINMPWMTYWTNSNYIWGGSQIKQLGLNLNAPGDRTSDKNVLWLEFPVTSGASPEIPVRIDTVNYFTIRKDPLSVTSENTSWISSSAIGGLRSLEITLSKDTQVAETTYRLNLYFSELEEKGPGERVFNVKLQDNTVLENFDIAGEAGNTDKEIVKSFAGVKAGNTLKVDLIPVKGNTILSGIELIQEPVALK